MQLSWNIESLISQYIPNYKNDVEDQFDSRKTITNLNTLRKASIIIDNRLFQRQKHKTIMTTTIDPATSTPNQLPIIFEPILM